MEHEATRTISRRRLAAGAAWAVPVVTLAGAAPAFAASQTQGTYGTICNLTYGDGTINAATFNIGFGWCSPDGVIRAGTVLTYRVASDMSLALPQLPGNTTTLSYSVVRIDTNTIEYRVTVNQDWTLSGTKCYCSSLGSNTMRIRWENSSYTMQPGATLTVSMSSSVAGSSPGSVKFKVAKRHASTPGDPVSNNTPHEFISKSGSQTCYPAVGYTTSANRSNPTQWACGVGLNSTSTTYPDGTCVTINSVTGTYVSVPERC